MSGLGFFFSTTSPAKTRILDSTSGPSSTRTMVLTALSFEVLHTATGTCAWMASSAGAFSVMYCV